MQRIGRYVLPTLTILCSSLHAQFIERWTPVGGPQEGEQIVTMAIDALTPSIIYAGSIYSGLYRSVDSGTTWDNIQPDFGDFPDRCPDVVSLVVNRYNPERLFVAVLGCGVFRSDDRGETWEPVNSGLEQTAVLTLAMDPVDPSVLWAGGISGDVYLSTDAGDSWISRSEGLGETGGVRTW